MSKKRYLTGGLLGLAALGACIGGAIAGPVYVIPKKVALETIDGTNGKPVTPNLISIQTQGIPQTMNGSTITLILDKGNFTTMTINEKFQLCNSSGPVAQSSTGINNSTLKLTLNMTADIPSGSYLTLKKWDGSNNCSDLGNNIIILPNVTHGDKVTISGKIAEVEPIQDGTLFAIEKKFVDYSLKPIESKLDYNAKPPLSRFENNNNASAANLYVKLSSTSFDSTYDVTNGDFLIEITGNFDGVDYSNSFWADSSSCKGFTISSDRTKISKTCPFDNTTTPYFNSTDSANQLVLYVNATSALTPREFRTTLKTKGSSGKSVLRDMLLFDGVMSHRWVLPGTTLYIPFVRHNATQNIFTIVKLQASKKGATSSYNIRAQVLRDDGTMQDVPICGGTLTAGQICTIYGDVLTTPVGKEETFAIINVDGPEDAIVCFVVYDYMGKSRRIPCKVQGGKIVE